MPQKPLFESIDVVFNGVTFRRYPNSSNAYDRNYYRASSQYHKQGIKYLHREIWKASNGPIPDGCHIHHIDGDTLNNAPENLECLTASDHAELHARTMPNWKRRWLASQVRTQLQPKATQWHRSEAGKSFHSKLGQWSWQVRTFIQKTCEVCAQEFRTKDTRTEVRFCSNKCKAMARRRTGVDDETRTCLWCQQLFTVNRYASVRCCSNSCAASLRQSKASYSDAWRKEHGEVSRLHWQDVEPVELICENCSASFKTRAVHGRTRFCSTFCKNAAYRRRKQPT